MPRFLLVLLTLALPATAARDTDWPDPPRDARPWLQWHWPSNLPSPADQSAELEGIARAGFGGVEIHPAQKTANEPEATLEWLGPEWIDQLAQASTQAERLGLSFGYSCVNGSNPGGPWLAPAFAATSLAPVIATTRGGPVELEIPEGPVDCLGAWPRLGQPIDLLPFVDPEGPTLKWEAPAGNWNIYGAISYQITQLIEGATPEAKGPVLDPFSPAAIDPWIGHIDRAFEFFDGPIPDSRSLDVTGLADVNWTTDFFAAARKRRGYDLREVLPALFADDETGTVDRVICDYHETLADLHRESLVAWHHDTHAQGALSRLRIRGSAGNPIDLHSIADIPGTTVIGLPDEKVIPLLRFPSSAAHISTKPLINASVFSQPTDSADFSPAQMKETVDLLWLGGANHLSLDGLTSLPSGSPPSQETRFTPLGPGSGRWNALPAFNSYITRCQTILQSGAPDPEVLLYYPAHDFWSERGGIPNAPDARAHWLEPTAFHRCATAFFENGITFDYVSDRLLSSVSVVEGQIILGGLNYKTIVIPEVRRLPETTAKLLLELTRRGARIAILGDWPQDVPGYPMPDIRRGTLFTSFQDIPDAASVEGSDPIALVEEFGIIPEPMAALGLRFVRRNHAEGHHYFIVNRSGKKLDAWVPLATPASSAVLMDPRFHRRNGVAPTRTGDEGLEVHLVLEPGESRILRTFTSKQAEGPNWTELTASFTPVAIGGSWKIEFLQGHPELPEAFDTPMLGSWTTLADPRAARFAGTARYSIDFSLPDSSSGKWLLDLGQVAHTAQIMINGNDAGSAFAPPHQFDISRFLKPGSNTLSIEVTNLAANRLHPGRAPIPSGLLGPVRLIPISQP